MASVCVSFFLDKEEKEIPLPNVKGAVLNKVVTYMKYHVDNPGTGVGRDLQVSASPCCVICCCQRRARIALVSPIFDAHIGGDRRQSYLSVDKCVHLWLICSQGD